MYKFPEDFDAAVFVGRTLEMVCVNANQVYFHFNDDLMICAESAFWFERQDNSFSDVKIPLDQLEVLQLLERDVARAQIKKGDVLTVTFDNGASLRFDPTPGYESYRVVVLGKDIFI
jgi:hypothetical protein